MNLIKTTPYSYDLSKRILYTLSFNIFSIILFSRARKVVKTFMTNYLLSKLVQFSKKKGPESIIEQPTYLQLHYFQGCFVIDQHHKIFLASSQLCPICNCFFQLPAFSKNYRETRKESGNGIGTKETIC